MTDRAPTPKQRQQRYQEAFLAGRGWASQELTLAKELGVDADFGDDLDDVAAAYLALQTGQLPSRVANDFASFERMIDLKQGFYDGAREVLDESASTSTDDETKADDEEGVLLSSGYQSSDPDAHSIFLTVEIQFEQHLIEECVAQAAHSLREVASRLEKGEEEGDILDKDGEEIGKRPVWLL